MFSLFFRMDVLFWFRKSESQPARPTGHPRTDLYGSISCRITVNGERCDVATTGVACWKSEWAVDRQEVRRRDRDYSREMTDNTRIADMRSELHSVHMLLISQVRADGGNLAEITALDVKRGFIDRRAGHSIKSGVRLGSVLTAWLEFQQKRESAGEISRSSFVNRSNYLANIREFMQASRRDLQIKEITGMWIDDLYFYLTNQKKYKASHTVKHLKTVKEALIWAKRRKVIKDNPIADYTIKSGDLKPDTTHLTKEHLKKLILFDPYPLVPEKLTPGMAKVLDQERDALLFTCFTGMHDGDYKRQEYRITVDEYGHWLEGVREKTNEQFRMLLDPVAVRILTKYGGVGQLPIRPNQKRNFYLKMLALTAQIPVHLTTKIGRKTFADRTLNELGYDPIDVAGMLGHRDVSSLKHYVKVKNERLANKFRPLDMGDESK